MEFIVRFNNEHMTEEKFRKAVDAVLPAVLTQAIVEVHGADLLYLHPEDDIPDANIPINKKKVVTFLTFRGEWHQRFTIVDATATEQAARKEALLAERWKEVKAIREQRISEMGVVITINGVKKGFLLDVLNRTRYLETFRKVDKLIAAGYPETEIVMVTYDDDSGAEDEMELEWKTMNNSMVPMTIKIVQQLAKAIEKQEATVFRRAEVLYRTMQAYPDPRMVDINVGWPDVYPELLP